ncbi:MAG: ABC transporter permease [Bryobacteraceae bacterium]|nr:ABC transporter permease [Bryobacteraceae bacterium]
MAASSKVEATLRGRAIHLSVRLPGASGLVGWQLYDPKESLFLSEGEWIPLNGGAAELEITVPEQDGPYRIYISPVDEERGWEYARGREFIIVDADASAGAVRLSPPRVTTLRALRLERWRTELPGLLAGPFRTLRAHWPLISSIVRRDVLARYRGSAGGVLWTVLNPLLLMATYFFVFGVVLQARFGGDPSRTGFALYFLTGMMPWLAFSEAAGRSPSVILEHRNFVKKLVFPVEVLPVVLVAAGLITELFAGGILVMALAALRGLHWSALWLPVLLIPQVMFTVGLAWLLSATGVFLRDLGQVIGFVLTLWFFITPICYPESALPAPVHSVLQYNPILTLVRGYRAVLLEGAAPDLGALGWLTLVSAAMMWAGYAWFIKLRRSFADVI